MTDFNAAQSYAGMDLVCVFIILAIGLLTRFCLARVGTPAGRVIYTVGICYSVNLVCDALWALGEGTGTLSGFAFYAVNALYFISLAAGSFCWFIYCGGRLGMFFVKKPLLRAVFFLPCAAVTALALSASGNGLLFFQNGLGLYARGPLFWIFPVANYSYIGISCALAFISVARGRGGWILFASSLPVLAFALLHVVLGINYASMGFMLMLFVLFWGEMVRLADEHKISRITAARLSKQKKMNLLKEKMALLLADDYDSVFMVNLATRSVTALRVTDAYEKSVERFPEEAAFFKRTSLGIQRNVHEEDRDYVSGMLRQVSVEKRLREDGGFSFVYRTVKDGVSYYNRMKLSRGDDPEYFVVGIKNVDEEMRRDAGRRRDLERLKVMRVFYALCEDYDCVLEIDPSRWTDAAYSVAGDYAALPGWESSMPYGERMRIIRDCLAAPEDRAGFFNAVLPENVMCRLRRDGVFLYDLRFVSQGRSRRMQVKYIMEGKDEPRIICGFRSLERELNIIEQNRRLERETVRQTAFFDLFVADYVSAFYIDLQTGAFAIYKIQPQLEPLLDRSDFEASMAKYINSVVYAPDREAMLKTCSRQNIKDRLEKEEGFTFIFRETLSGKPEYHRLRIRRGADRLHAAAAFMDVNEEFVREALEKERLEARVAERTGELRLSNERLNKMSAGIVDLLGNVVETRDIDSGRHVHRVKDLTAILVSRVMKNCPEYGITPETAEQIALVSPLHDVGKIAIPDNILLKRGSLSEEEFALMKTHCRKGSELIENIGDNWDADYLKMSMDICLYHHEKWDGRGYPEGLAGDDIPIAAQIVSVADIFDALTSERSYKRAYSPAEAVDMILRGECGAFSEKLMQCFRESVEDMKKCAEESYER